MITSPALEMKHGADDDSAPELAEVGYESKDVEASVLRTDFVEGQGMQADEVRIQAPLDAKTATVEFRPRSRAGFLRVYGWMGIPMVVIFVLSALWTIMLAVIQYAPTTVANYLMDTDELDRGDFWMLEKAETPLVGSAIAILAVISASYLGLVVLMLFPDKLLRKRSKTPADGYVAPVQLRKRSARLSTTIPIGLTRARIIYEMTSPHGLLRHYYNPVLDLPKLVFQTSTMFTYLLNGFPVAVIFIYSSLLFINWMISTYRYKRERPDPHFIVCRIFYSFDLFFAVFAPLEVLTYAYYTFFFDRALFSTRVATLTAASFDRTARLFADPTQVSLFRIAFHYLQFTTTSSLLVKCALNALSLFKWQRTIVHLVDHAHATSKPRDLAVVGSAERIKLANVRRRQVLQNAFIAAVFFCAGTAIFIYSIVAVVSSRQVCSPYTQCKVPSYQWSIGADKCSCIVFVDRDARLKTFDEWQNPVDTTANLAALAATGHLRIIQIINRELPTLPSELRGCHSLEQLILIYTKTVTFPDWAKEFTKLEYLHIEGDLTAKQLVSIPRDLFANMPHLAFLHLGCLVKLPYVPDLKNLKHLEYLVLAMLHSITEIPSLESLHNLKRLNIIDAIRVYELPPTHLLKHLKTFALASRSPSCCNGFVTGNCTLSAFSCLDRTASGEPLVQCTSKRMAAEDYHELMATEGVVCEPNLTFDLKDLTPTFDSIDGSCGGVMFKQCTMNGTSGMCYPARMQPISCQLDQHYQAMRRLEIQRGVGDPCDPVIEGWLGCKA